MAIGIEAGNGTGAAVVAANHAVLPATVATGVGMKRVGKGLEIAGVKPRSWSDLARRTDLLPHGWRTSMTRQAGSSTRAGQPIDTKHVIPPCALFGAGNKFDAAGVRDHGAAIRRPIRTTVAARMRQHGGRQRWARRSPSNGGTLTRSCPLVSADHVKGSTATYSALGNLLLDIIRTEESPRRRGGGHGARVAPAGPGDRWRDEAREALPKDERPDAGTVAESIAVEESAVPAPIAAPTVDVAAIVAAAVAQALAAVAAA